MKMQLVFVTVAICLLIAGCGAKISETEAQKNAEIFVTEHVKFFSQEGDEKVNLTAYNFSGSTVSVEKGQYVVRLKVTATLENLSKSNELTIILDRSSGKVVKFNGQKI
jgi:hypothetical protein